MWESPEIQRLLFNTAPDQIEQQVAEGGVLSLDAEQIAIMTQRSSQAMAQSDALKIAQAKRNQRWRDEDKHSGVRKSLSSVPGVGGRDRLFLRLPGRGGSLHDWVARYGCHQAIVLAVYDAGCQPIAVHGCSEATQTARARLQVATPTEAPHGPSPSPVERERTHDSVRVSVAANDSLYELYDATPGIAPPRAVPPPSQRTRYLGHRAGVPTRTRSRASSTLSRRPTPPVPSSRESRDTRRVHGGGGGGGGAGAGAASPGLLRRRANDEAGCVTVDYPLPAAVQAVVGLKRAVRAAKANAARAALQLEIEVEAQQRCQEWEQEVRSWGPNGHVPVPPEDEALNPRATSRVSRAGKSTPHPAVEGGAADGRQRGSEGLDKLHVAQGHPPPSPLPGAAGSVASTDAKQARAASSMSIAELEEAAVAKAPQHVKLFEAAPVTSYPPQLAPKFHAVEAWGTDTVRGARITMGVAAWSDMRVYCACVYVRRRWRWRGQ